MLKMRCGELANIGTCPHCPDCVCHPVEAAEREPCPACIMQCPEDRECPDCSVQCPEDRECPPCVLSCPQDRDCPACLCPPIPDCRCPVVPEYSCPPCPSCPTVSCPTPVCEAAICQSPDWDLLDTRFIKTETMMRQWCWRGQAAAANVDKIEVR